MLVQRGLQNIVIKWIPIGLYPVSFVPPGKGTGYLRVFYNLLKHVFITLGYKEDWNLIKSPSLIWNIHNEIYD